ncbi:S8 family serine peptidase [Stenoxybacter acetivorans]|uniref:S8 family serine peptidase n=1 Tax=Stenoxybacter acetivorans TaxID=422441 RepID=UPI00055DC98E|nr:S8 family serine peptidase [Stenoxybacter acetivorans]
MLFNSFKKNFIAASICSAFLLSACGSGGSGSGIPGTPDVNPPETTPTPPITPPVITPVPTPTPNPEPEPTPEPPPIPEPPPAPEPTPDDTKVPISTVTSIKKPLYTPPADGKTYLQRSEADKSTAKGKGATIIVADSGINKNHRLLKNINIANEKKDETYTWRPMSDDDGDSNGHGTHMTIVMTNNAPEARFESTPFGSNNWVITNRFNDYLNDDKNYNGNYATVINNSWGSSEYSQINASDLNSLTRAEIKEVLDSIFSAKERQAVKNIIDNGSLYVAAAGNDGEKGANRPVLSSLLPIADTSLEKGFLTVTAVEKNLIAYFANPCGGIAKSFCLAAPGVFTIDKVTVRGTSHATAYVSGVAAAVKSRYDWMKNKELKDVLLTTATDLGAKGVDDIYGQGLVNPEKARKGYGRFDTATELNVNGSKDVYYFDNDISGSGSVIKKGADALVLNGNNTFSGTNQIHAGTLVLNGKNQAASNILADGELSVGDNAAGISSGSINNKGLLSAETKQNFTINGTLISTGTINKAIGSKIIVSGNATLDKSTFNISKTAQGYVTQQGKTEVLLTAKSLSSDGIVINAPEAISSLIESNATVDDTSISVTMKRQSAATAAALSSAFMGKTESAAALDAVFSQYDKKLENGQQLTANQAAFANHVLYTENLNKTLFQYSPATLKNAQENLSVTEAKQNAQFIADAQQHQDSIWINYQHDQARLKLNGLSGKWRDNGFTLGGAKTLSGKQTLAAAVSSKQGNWQEELDDAAQSLDTSGVGLDLAYIYSLDSGYRLYGQIGYNWLKNKNGYSKENARQYSAGIGVNKDFMLNEQWTLTPNLAVQYLNTKQNHFALFDNGIAINDFSTKHTVLLLGLAARYAYNSRLAFFGSLNLEQDLNKTSRFRMDFAGVDLKSSSKAIGKTRADVGLGVRYGFTDKLNMSVAANHSQGKHWRDNRVNVKLAYRF